MHNAIIDLVCVSENMGHVCDREHLLGRVIENLIICNPELFEYDLENTNILVLLAILGIHISVLSY
jgi:hypothetical protein